MTYRSPLKGCPDVSDADYKARLKARCLIEPFTGCWLFQGFVHPTTGYGEFCYRGKNMRAHRASYTLSKGVIPPGKDVCHSCDVPHCVNPDHLFLGTHKENMTDCRQKGRHFLSKKTHCKRNHEFTPDNTRVGKNGARTCLTCERERHQTKKYVRGLGRHFKTECIHGHPMSGKNLVVTADGRRRCRRCNANDALRRAERRRQQSVPAVSTESP